MSRAMIALITGITALVVLLTALGASAQTQTPGFGGIVGDVDDIEHVIGSDGPDTLQFRDGDGDGTLDRDEAVYLAESSTLEDGDLRITDSFAGDAFTKVRSGDGDAGRDLTTLDGTFRYFDVNADGAFTPDDTLYYDLASTSQGEASRGDVILAGTDAGTLVTTDHEYHRFGLNELDQNPRFGYYDEDDDNTLDRSDALMIDIDDDGHITIADVRLGGTPGGEAGTIVAFGDADATYFLEDFNQQLEFQFIGSGSFSSNDRSFLTSGDQVQRNAIRLTNPLDDHHPGSQVSTGDTDWGISTTNINGAIAYVDEDGGGALTAGDTVVYDVDNDGEINRGDILLSGETAGDTATGSNANLGDTLESWSGTIRYLDTDADNQYSHGDIVYADTDNDDIVNQGAVQLSQNPDTLPEATPPTVTITSPSEDDTITAGDAVAIQGTASAGDADLDTVEVTVGDEELDVTGTQDWSTTWTPESEGEYTITATVTDEDDQTNSTSLTVTVQEQPPPGTAPTVSITTPTDEDEFSETETVTIEGTATPGDAELSEITVEVDGEPIPVDGLAEWSATWDPTGPGSYLIEATATDDDNLTATQHVNITIEEQQDPPTITIQQPGDGTEVPVGETVTIEGTASAGSADITRIRVTVGGDELDVDGTGQWSAEWTPETEGDHVIEATARDQDGQTATDSITVTTVAETPAPSIIAVMIATLAAAGITRKNR